MAILGDVAEMTSAQAGMAAAATAVPNRRRSAKAALRLLMDGNRRFVAGAPMYQRNISSARAAAGEQRPVAAVFTCVDSRVTVESLFDCDFGQLIVVRTAGHVVDRAAVSSLEFAAANLAVPLVMVLGHERCGAITLAVDTVRKEPADASAGYLIDSLRGPATAALRDEPADPYRAATRTQIEDTVALLRKNAQLDVAQVVGARYDLDNGTVRLID